MPPLPSQPLRILHVVRTPIGGIFRHVLDLASGQADRGHDVGIIADSLTGGPRAVTHLAGITPRMKLGVHRLAMRRNPAPDDVLAWFRVTRFINLLRPDVIHGHGAKPGAYVRLQRGSADTIRVYTPHGGSLHYPLTSIKGLFYAALERLLKPSSDLCLFESAFARDTYLRTIGPPKGLVRCVFNGVKEAEFAPLTPDTDATDLIYVGEFRAIKGADLLIDALAHLHQGGRKLTLTLAGDGEEMPALQAQLARRDLQAAVRFVGHVEARDGFRKGRLLVVPSRGDSMPYVVLEAGAAGIPVIAARVGGIPEILRSDNPSLFAPSDPLMLAQAITTALDAPKALRERSIVLQERIRTRFSQQAMVDGVLAAYREAFDHVLTVSHGPSGFLSRNRFHLKLHGSEK